MSVESQEVIPLALIPNTDPRLHQVCDPIGQINADIIILAHDMLKTMYAHHGCGLAAPQVGHNIRLVVMDCSGGRSQPAILINPTIGSMEYETESTEGCLSFPGLACQVKRHARVTINFLNERGEAMYATVNGLWAICVQHEIDHLDGITMDQRGKVVA